MTKLGLFMLILFQLKHWLADYPLQRPWMLGKFKPGWGFVLPLAAHCFVHAWLTYAITLIAHAAMTGHKDQELSVNLAMFDFTIHFVMDRIKASPKLMGRWKPLFGKEFFDTTLVAKTRAKLDPVNVPKAKAALRSNRLFWDALGFDQLVHHLTHYTIIWFLLNGF